MKWNIEQDILRDIDRSVASILFRQRDSRFAENPVQIIYVRGSPRCDLRRTDSLLPGGILVGKFP